MLILDLKTLLFPEIEDWITNLIIFRPFLRLNGASEVERLEGWEDLEPGVFYSQVKDFT
jgi:hypothetical protein